MRTGVARVSKRTWYGYGGFANTALWRRMRRGVWQYYVDVERFTGGIFE